MAKEVAAETEVVKKEVAAETKALQETLRRKEAVYNATLEEYDTARQDKRAAEAALISERDEAAAKKWPEIIGPFRTVATTAPKVTVVLYVADAHALRRLPTQSGFSPAGRAETAENRPF